MTLSFDSAPSFVAALISLRSETAKSISDATDIKPANLSVWLRGREQVISQKRVVTLLGYLDVIGGNLARGKIHRWSAYENFDALNLVLSNLLTEEEKLKSIICSDCTSGFPYTKFLGLWSDVGWVWISLSVQAGIATAPLMRCADLGFGYEYVLPIDFKSLPLDNCAKIEEILLAAIEALGSEAGAEIVKFMAPSALTEINNASRNEVSEMESLQATLQKVIDTGVSPKEITQLLLAKFLS